MLVNCVLVLLILFCHIFAAPVQYTNDSNGVNENVTGNPGDLQNFLNDLCSSLRNTQATQTSLEYPEGLNRRISSMVDALTVVRPQVSQLVEIVACRSTESEFPSVHNDRLVPEEKRAVVVRGISECWADVFPRFVNRLLEPPRSPWSYPILGLVPVVFFQAAVGAIMVSLVYTCYLCCARWIYGNEIDFHIGGRSGRYNVDNGLRGGQYGLRCHSPSPVVSEDPNDQPPGYASVVPEEQWNIPTQPL